MPPRILYANKKPSLRWARAWGFIAILGIFFSASISSGVLFTSFVIIGLYSVAIIFICFAKVSYLALKDEGFIICELFPSKLVAWSDVGEFYVGAITDQSAALFTYPNRPEHANPLARRLMRAFIGESCAVVNCYAISTEELVALLNMYRLAGNKPSEGQ